MVAAGALTSHTGALDQVPDFAEVRIWLRLEAKDAFLQSIAEAGLARAERTRTQQPNRRLLGKMKANDSNHIWRAPKEKVSPGRRARPPW